MPLPIRKHGQNSVEEIALTARIPTVGRIATDCATPIQIAMGNVIRDSWSEVRESRDTKHEPRSMRILPPVKPRFGSCNDMFLPQRAQRTQRKQHNIVQMKRYMENIWNTRRHQMDGNLFLSKCSSNCHFSAFSAFFVGDCAVQKNPTADFRLNRLYIAPIANLNARKIRIDARTKDGRDFAQLCRNRKTTHRFVV